MTPEQYVQDKAARSGSSFYYAFLFLPPPRRAAITAFYAFCREVDDVVDEVSDPAVAATKLAWWRKEVAASFSGNPSHPATKALLPHTQAYAIEARHLLAVIDHHLPARIHPAHPAFHGQPRNAGDGGQGLAPETQRGDQLDRFVGQLGGGMAFQCQRHVFAGHPAAVVGHLDQAQSALAKADGDTAGAGINRVFDQLFQRRRRTLNHLARSDAVDQGFGEAADHWHLFPTLAVKCTEFETSIPTQSPCFGQIFGLCSPLAVMSRDSRQPTGF